MGVSLFVLGGICFPQSIFVLHSASVFNDDLRASVHLRVGMANEHAVGYAELIHPGHSMLVPCVTSFCVQQHEREVIRSGQKI